VIGEGAFDEAGNKNTQFLQATSVGPFPKEMQKAWDVMRDEAADNYGSRDGFEEEEAAVRMGPLAAPTPAAVRNRGAAERMKSSRVHALVTEHREPRREEGDGQQH
jgi:hypothetical protein